MNQLEHSSLPLVALPADAFSRGIHPFQGVGEKYINAIVHGCDALPVLLPALGTGGDLVGVDQTVDFNQLVRRFDGICLPGSAANIDPQHYDPSLQDDGSDRDHQRDATTLKLIVAALEEGVPLLAICRGFQELNVVCGGTLHQAVHNLPDHMDHREDKTLSREQQYAKAHSVALTEGGVLQQRLGARTAQVNSIHGQGINRLGDGLVVEAIAADGLVEAVRVKDSKALALAVQWHPEWRFNEDALSVEIFRLFGEAVLKRQLRQ